MLGGMRCSHPPVLSHAGRKQPFGLVYTCAPRGVEGAVKPDVELQFYLPLTAHLNANLPWENVDSISLSTGSARAYHN